MENDKTVEILFIFMTVRPFRFYSHHTRYSHCTKHFFWSYLF